MDKNVVPSHGQCSDMRSALDSERRTDENPGPLDSRTLEHSLSFVRRAFHSLAENTELTR
jgi:hypothetical protein